MNIYKIFLAIAIISFLSNCCGSSIIQGSYKGFESENYTILRKENNIEIRQYHESVIAKVDAQGDIKTALQEGRNILSDYFFEKNNLEEEIVMTTPFTQQGSANQWRIYVTMPRLYTLENNEEIAPQEDTSSPKLKALLLNDPQNQEIQPVAKAKILKPKIQPLPIPLDERIRITKTKPATVVAIIFSGFVTKNNLEKNLHKLEKYIAKENIKVINPHFYAFYDSDFTMPYNRRMEILFTLTDDLSNDIFKKTR